MIQYGASGTAGLTDPGPKERGKNYFIGGPSNEASSASQTIDVSALSPVLAKGTTTFSLSAYIGGYSDQSDHTVLPASFRNKAGQTLKTVTLGPVTAAQRKNVTCLLPLSKTGTVPAGTESVVIFLKMIRTDGFYNDGSADNLLLVTGLQEIIAPEWPSCSCGQPHKTNPGRPGTLSLTATRTIRQGGIKETRCREE